MTYDILIHNATVLTLNERFDVVRDGVVGISGGRIESVTSRTPGEGLPAAKRVVDAGGGIILPGLINTHTHAAMSLFRGLADDLPLMTWLEDHIFRAESRWLNEESVYAAARLSFAEMLLSGTTTCCDGYFFEAAVAEAAHASGIRAVLAQGIVDFPAPGVPNPEENVARALDFVRCWQGRSPLIRPGLFCHSPYTCGEETLRAARAAADEAGCLLQIHVAETRAEVEILRRDKGATPFEYLDAIGLLNPNTLAVHAVWATPEDVTRMATHGVGVSVTTESEMKLASGVAPVPRFLDAGLAIGLGTDGCASNNNQDMVQEMGFTARLHKVHAMDPTALDARTLVYLATMGGATALGMADEIGAVTAGKRADIIVVDVARPHSTPLYDPYSHLVYAANGRDVRHVFIDGHLVVEDGSVLTMDLDEVMGAMVTWGRRIASWAHSDKR